jgi:uncharacterized paraquat-inducible protein A
MDVNLKGVIKCPVCDKNLVFVYPDAKGHASVQCKRCERFLLVDYDKMMAASIPPICQKSLKICK